MRIAHQSDEIGGNGAGAMHRPAAGAARECRAPRSADIIADDVEAEAPGDVAPDLVGLIAPART
jgi:hypothetical protein